MQVAYTTLKVKGFPDHSASFPSFTNALLSKWKWLKEMPIFCFDTSKIYDNADDCFKTTLVLEPQWFSNCFHFFTKPKIRKNTL